MAGSWRFQTPSAGPKARKITAQGKRDKVRAALGYVSKEFSSAVRAKEFYRHTSAEWCGLGAGNGIKRVLSESIENTVPLNVAMPVRSAAINGSIRFR